MTELNNSQFSSVQLLRGDESSGHKIIGSRKRIKQKETERPHCRPNDTMMMMFKKFNQITKHT